MKTKPQLISSKRQIFLTETGKTIVTIMKVRQFVVKKFGLPIELEK
jgi:hypothetical protein